MTLKRGIVARRYSYVHVNLVLTLYRDSVARKYNYARVMSRVF